MNELISLNTANIPVYNNRRLNNATAKVYALGEKIRKNALETAAIVALVDMEGTYKDDGFKTVHDWTLDAFGFKKSTSYNMLNVGREYVKPVLSPKTGKTVGYESVFADKVEDGDFTITQLTRLLPAGKELASELVENGEVSPAMTCKEIKEVVDAARADDEEEQEEQTDNTEGQEEQTGNTAEHEEEELERRTAEVDILPDGVEIHYGNQTYKFSLEEWADHMTTR